MKYLAIDIGASSGKMLEARLEELGAPLPSVSIIAAEDNDPYRILTSTIISLRTRDAVTLAASKYV